MSGIYNVRLSVVALVRADSAEAAVVKLTHIVDDAGMSTFRDGASENEPQVFESEPLSEAELDFVL